MTRLTLSIATLSLLILSSPLSFAGNNDSNKPGLLTDAAVAVGGASGFASYVNLKNAQKKSEELSQLNKDIRSTVNQQSAAAQKPFKRELEQLENPRFKEAEARIQFLEQEQNALSAQLGATNSTESKAVIQLNSKLTEKEIVATQHKLAEIRAWFPFDAIKRVSDYIANGRQEGPGVPKPTQAELELWENPKIKETYDDYLALETRLLKRDLAKLQRSLTPTSQEAHAGQVNIQDVEKRLARIKQELTELKTWYPANLIERARARVRSVSEITSNGFKADPKLFSEAETAGLLTSHEEIQNALSHSSTVTQALAKQLRSLQYIGAATGGLSLIALGSAISDLREKKAASILDEGYAPAEQQSGSVSARSLK
jgi:hypothetical protein